MIRQSLALAVAFGLLAQDAAFAQQPPVLSSKQTTITWKELSALIVEKKVSTTLPDGTRLTGEALAVRPGVLVLDVQSTSNRKLHPKGQTEVPRQGITEIRVMRTHGPVARIFLGILGGVGGALGAGVLAFVTDSLAVALSMTFVGIPLAAVGGYYLGKMIDTSTTRLLIQESSQTGAMEDMTYEIW